VKNEFSHIKVGSKVWYAGKLLTVKAHWTIKEHQNGFNERVPCLVLTDGIDKIEINDLNDIKQG